MIPKDKPSTGVNMLNSFIQKFATIVILTATFSLPAAALDYQADIHSQVIESSSIAGIETSPLLLSNDNLSHNTLKGSVHDLLNSAHSSILIISFSFSDPEVIQLLNKKADEGVFVQLIIDRDHLVGLKQKMRPSVQIGTRSGGEGHLHHKMLVVDSEYVWIGSANFTTSAYSTMKNLAIGFYSPEIGAQLHQEASDIASSSARSAKSPFTTSYGEQLLEVYVLPHNAPESPRATETAMNDAGKEKLIGLIDGARHHLKISVDVWTYKDASRAVINAMQRGVKVDVVVGNTTEEAVKMMIQAGIPVKQGQNLHFKFMLVDNEIFLNGSPNWSMNAFSRSDESYVVLYNLTEEQLSALEGVLKVAGLPLETHFNEGVVVDDTPEESFNEEIYAKIALVNKTIAALNDEIGKSPVSQENKRLISIARRLSADLGKFIPQLATAPVPGCCLYEGGNFLATVVAIAEKQEKVETVVKYINSIQGTDQKVHDYFLRTLKKLQAGINAPLPDYFHATRNGLGGIISSQKIMQSIGGVTGPGTYVSCNNEGDYGYGTHAFAIDEGCLIDTQATFRTGRHPITNVFFSLWASVLKDIPVSEETIAFIDTSKEDVPAVMALLEQQDLHIEVVDRNTADAILKLFDLTTKRRELPSFYWQKHKMDDYLPQNMYPRSEQGTFRQFMFGT